MTQNFNLENISYTNEHHGAEFEFSHVVGGTTIYLHADSNNNVYRVQYKTLAVYRPFFELLCTFIKDKNIDDLISNLTESFSKEDTDSEKQFSIQYSLLVLKESLMAYIGEGRSFSDINSNEIICRCTHIDNLLLKNTFNKFKGNKTEILKATNMGLICGSCRNYGNEKLKLLVGTEGFYEGESFDDWQVKINTAIEEFGFYSPKEFSGALIEVKELCFPKVILGIKGHSEELDEKFAVRSLNNYLAQELKVLIEIEVILL
jgi:bacterioferritin-associated ferredoxin